MAQTPPQPPPRIIPEAEIVPTMRRLIDKRRRLLDTIIASVPPSGATFDNVVRPIVDLWNAQAGEQAVIDALKYCALERSCQHAVEDAQTVWREYVATARRPALYDRLHAVKNRRADYESLDPESQLLVDSMLEDFELDAGFGMLDEAGRARRQVRAQRMQELCTAFNRTVREEAGAGERLTADDVDGIDASDREAPDGQPPAGSAFYSLDTKYRVLMRKVHKAATRERVFRAEHRRCPGNLPLFREVVQLRDAHARELGYANHAEAKLPHRLAASMADVAAQVQRLADTLRPFGREQFDKVDAVRRRCLAHGAGGSNHASESGDAVAVDSMPPWDYLYYNAIREKEAGAGPDDDGTAISEYFPLLHTFGAMLNLFADCLQLRFVPLPADELAATVWHEDVQGWTVWDARPEHSGEFVGHLYADLLSRPDKYKGNQSVNLQPGYIKPDGTRVYPANTVMCGLHLPKEKGYLLSHRNVATLFHELGHSIHDLVARTRYARFHGYAVALELGEGIGMMLEHLCYVPAVLRAIGRHYTRVDPAYMEAWVHEHPSEKVPPEQVPEALLAQRIQQRAENTITKLLQWLITAQFDLDVHSPPSREVLLRLDEGQLYRDIYARNTFRQLPEDTWAHATEWLLFSGYDAGYYAYIYAEILAADLFQTTFADDPLSPAAWARFREGILEPGGSRNGLEMVEAFLGGRPMDSSALLATLGIDNAIPSNASLISIVDQGVAASQRTPGHEPGRPGRLYVGFHTWFSSSRGADDPLFVASSHYRQLIRLDLAAAHVDEFTRYVATMVLG
ncbi:metallopeptidase MepB [Niveomyces insectorum RCEF 264]|uniref:Metallopeptidase MepB n=1 Tax=Niveomyces insectorum RCEF 264 TaxID=1081102 RepID=A0A167Y5J3_9HYPO|nr:metallopeptidase MepB [Niveomyces insectorum RCEF 264]